MFSCFAFLLRSIVSPILEQERRNSSTEKKNIMSSRKKHARITGIGFAMHGTRGKGTEAATRGKKVKLGLDQTGPI
jgi:hypothetical protein